jgi:hypothetical protein
VTTDEPYERSALKGPGELPACPQAARSRSELIPGTWKYGSSDITYEADAFG